MKYLLPLLLVLSACTTISTRFDVERTQLLLQQAASLTGRQLELAPTVYLVNDWAEFRRISCGQYRVGCVFGTIQAMYIPSDRAILVNLSILDEPLDAILVHELVHHLQSMQHDRRGCFEREAEAYQAQQKFSGVETNIYRRAVGSCIT